MASKQTTAEDLVAALPEDQAPCEVSATSVRLELSQPTSLGGFPPEPEYVDHDHIIPYLLSYRALVSFAEAEPSFRLWCA